MHVSLIPPQQSGGRYIITLTGALRGPFPLRVVSNRWSSPAFHLVRALSGFDITSAGESGNKVTRFGPFSAQCRAGNVKILRGPWNEDLFRVLEGFPDLAHDDEVDACSGALEMLNPDMKSYGAYELARRQAEQLRAEQHRDKPQPTQPTWAIGSMEWLAEQNKSS